MVSQWRRSSRISAAGIDLSSLALVASALSVGIGFGLQNIVSNFVSGLILLVERPFKVGDWIVSGTSEGIVKRISVRATEIETFRKQSIIVPNSGTDQRLGRQLDAPQPAGSLGNSGFRQFRCRSAKGDGSLLELVRDIPKVLRNPEPHVEFLRIGPSSLDFEMRFYLSDLSDGMEIRNNLRIDILKRFREEGLPFPIRIRSCTSSATASGAGRPTFGEHQSRRLRGWAGSRERRCRGRHCSTGRRATAAAAGGQERRPPSRQGASPVT